MTRDPPSTTLYDSCSANFQSQMYPAECIVEFLKGTKWGEEGKVYVD
jgi:hypothetical protein